MNRISGQWAVGQRAGDKGRSASRPAVRSTINGSSVDDEGRWMMEDTGKGRKEEIHARPRAVRVDSATLLAAGTGWPCLGPLTYSS